MILKRLDLCLQLFASAIGFLLTDDVDFISTTFTYVLIWPKSLEVAWLNKFWRSFLHIASERHCVHCSYDVELCLLSLTGGLVDLVGPENQLVEYCGSLSIMR